MKNKTKVIAIASMALVSLFGCAGHSPDKATNDIWCTHQDNTHMDQEEAIFPGQIRKPYADECTDISAREYPEQDAYVDKAVKTKMDEESQQ